MSRVEKIGDATLYLGDCREILPTLERLDAIVTDPPYGIQDAAFDGGQRSGKRTGGDNTWHAESWWDKELDPEWMRLCGTSAEVVAWFGHWRKREQVEQAMPLPLRAEIVWAKDCHVGPPCPVAMRDERIWLFSAAGIKGKTFETSVWDCPIIPTWSFKNHKNEKPTPLMVRLIRFLDPATVCDPFMGSGTTGVAAVKTGKRFVGIELDAKHFETACRRISDALSQPDMFVQVEKRAVEIQQDMLVALETYDAADDFGKSIEACYEAVRERVAEGGPGWPERPITSGKRGEP